eukprot:scaffold17817_cov33-Tisochrysis_lutea.AAC.1
MGTPVVRVVQRDMRIRHSLDCVVQVLSLGGGALSFKDDDSPPSRKDPSIKSSQREFGRRHAVRRVVDNVERELARPLEARGDVHDCGDDEILLIGKVARHNDRDRARARLFSARRWLAARPAQDEID